MEIRKIVTIVEDVFADGEKKAEKPVRKAACIAVIKNPYAGKYQEDLSALIDFSEEIGKTISERAVEALGRDRSPESYGKAAIVGEKSELVHAAARSGVPSFVPRWAAARPSSLRQRNRARWGTP